MNCDYLPDCIFFNDRMRNMPSMSEVLKQDFCRDDWQDCARRMVRTQLGKEAVPPDLFPDEIEKAKRLISSAKH